jgi:hypothetical protein
MIELLILYMLSKRENTMYGLLKYITDEFGAYTACLILLGDDYNLVIVAPKELGDFGKVRELLRG